ncbi:MAG: PKD domain-containing protein, partial [Proteobacteria bacterium]|nr:PKD domain-containing protein [Pseudomonadota bacterium]
MNRPLALKSVTNSWLKLTLAIACTALLIAPSCKKQDSGHTANDASLAKNPNVDDNHNHMLDKYEIAKDQGADCAEKHNTGCIDGFCDSFLDYKCSTRCTSDDQCVSNDYFCRDDGRCVPKAFVSVWKVAQDNTEITFPGGKGEGCNYTIDWGDGTKESYTDCAITRKHTYEKADDYTISVTGTLLNWACVDNVDDFDEDSISSFCYVGNK